MKQVKFITQTRFCWCGYTINAESLAWLEFVETEVLAEKILANCDHLPNFPQIRYNS